jgi:hypothetical protein
VLDSWVPRELFGPKREEIAGGWRTLHSEELHDLYSSPNIISLIKLWIMRWAGHVTCIGEEEKRMQGFGEEA